MKMAELMKKREAEWAVMLSRKQQWGVLMAYIKRKEALENAGGKESKKLHEHLDLIVDRHMLVLGEYVWDYVESEMECKEMLVKAAHQMLESNEFSKEEKEIIISLGKEIHASARVACGLARPLGKEIHAIARVACGLARPDEEFRVDCDGLARPDEEFRVDCDGLARPDEEFRVDCDGLARPDEEFRVDCDGLARPDEEFRVDCDGLARPDEEFRVDCDGLARPDEEFRVDCDGLARPDEEFRVDCDGFQLENIHEQISATYAEKNTKA